MRCGGFLILAACLFGQAGAAPEPPANPERLAVPEPSAVGRPSGDSYLAYSGVARSRRSGEVLYGEHHVLLYRQGRLAERVVLYTCPDGSAFARKTVAYVDPFAPDFLLDDAMSGMREGIRSSGQDRTVFYRGNRLQAERSKTLPLQGLVADAGFDEYIRAHWRALMSGQTLQLHFLVPSRLAEVNFKLQHLRGDTLNGAPVAVMRLKLSGILGDVLPSIDVAYDAADHVLVRYEGLSDLRDAAGANFQAQIDFPPGERAPVDAAAMAAGREAPLGACK